MKSTRWLLIPLLAFPLSCLAETNDTGKIIRESEDATAALEKLATSENPGSKATEARHAKKRSKKKRNRKSRGKTGQVSTSDVPEKALRDERKKAPSEYPTAEAFEMNPARRIHPAIQK